MAFPLLKDAFQIAYVTNDLERAAGVFHEQYGTREFLIMRDLPDAYADLALAYSGDTMIELLQPLAQSGDFYSDYIAGCDGFVIKHHHFGMLLDSREAMAETRAAHVGQGNAIVYEGGETGAAVQYLYADCRAPWATTLNTFGWKKAVVRCSRPSRAVHSPDQA